MFIINKSPFIINKKHDQPINSLSGEFSVAPLRIGKSGGSPDFSDL
jgi:hypothetical protein